MCIEIKIRMHDWRHHYKVFSLGRSRSQRKKDKAVSLILENDPEKKFLVVSHTNLVLVSREPLLHLEILTIPINKMFLRLIYLKNSTFPSVKTTVE